MRSPSTLENSTLPRRSVCKTSCWNRVIKLLFFLFGVICASGRPFDSTRVACLNTIRVYKARYFILARKNTFRSTARNLQKWSIGLNDSDIQIDEAYLPCQGRSPLSEGGRCITSSSVALANVYGENFKKKREGFLRTVNKRA